jgi:DNA repair protein RecN (Recombination protein N)
MLQSLRIRNLAIADDVSVEFVPGLNVITGETGAGKSLMVAALNLVLGERADRTMIRAGEETCTVEAAFELSDTRAVDAVLADLGLAECDAGQLIIRRIVSSAGASRNLVNDSSATLQTLKALGDVLVDLHGPHDHQSLLSPAFQLQVLDEFGQTRKELAAYREVFDAIRALEARRAELESAGENTAERIETLRYQLSEIDDAQVSAGEEDAVTEELTRVANASRILELAGAARAALTEDEAAAFNRLVDAQRALGELTGLMGRAAGEWLQEAKGLAMQAQELSNSIASESERIDADPGRLQWLENRMAVLQKLKRKHGATLADVLAARERLAASLADLETRGERLAAMDAELRALRARRTAAGGELTAARARAARKLSAAVVKELKDLGFAHGGFDAALSGSEPQRSGLDAVEFGFAPNVGEPMRPLRAIASSGEISRVMLAVKAALAAHDRIPVLVFDEIDANLGGVTGSAVGLKLARVAATHQVLCITHLPQVAVHGARHLVVGKEVHQKRTLTRITPVEGDARAEEIARMLGGKDLTSVTLQHAREMLKPAGAARRSVSEQ